MIAALRTRLCAWMGGTGPIGTEHRTEPSAVVVPFRPRPCPEIRIVSSRHPHAMGSRSLGNGYAEVRAWPLLGEVCASAAYQISPGRIARLRGG